MGLSSGILAALQAARDATESLGLRVDITLEAWTGQDAYGAPTYAAGVAIPAVVQFRPQARRNARAEEIAARALVMFQDEIAANGAADRQEPIDPRDRITLPDGTTGPILAVQGQADPVTGLPLALSQVWLGWGGTAR